MPKVPRDWFRDFIALLLVMLLVICGGYAIYYVWVGDHPDTSNCSDVCIYKGNFDE